MTATSTTVRVRNRLVEYLSLPGVPPKPTASREARALERFAAGRAVSFFDYDWLMERVDESGGRRSQDRGGAPSSSSLGTGKPA